MPEKVGNIELYMGPQEVGGNDNLLGTIVEFINGDGETIIHSSPGAGFRANC